MENITISQEFISFKLLPVDNRRLADLCGLCDEHLRQIERQLGVEIVNRGNEFTIIGASELLGSTRELLEKLYTETEKANNVTPATVQLFLQEASNFLSTKTPDKTKISELTIKTKNTFIKARSPNQYHYLKSIAKNDICFGIGPAGTGKTYLAVACAVEALEKELISRLVLVRPAVEAGERLGFLPGDLTQKVDPYLRPLYDALYEMLGFEEVSRLLERGVIEIAPLAFMRGRTLNDSFIILDEGQNTTKEQMKMFLTRIGFGSKTVITGDITQTDLPKGTISGLRDAIAVLKDVEGISFTFFQAHDVVRHPLVQKIVHAYNAFDK